MGSVVIKQTWARKHACFNTNMSYVSCKMLCATWSAFDMCRNINIDWSLMHLHTPITAWQILNYNDERSIIKHNVWIQIWTVGWSWNILHLLVYHQRLESTGPFSPIRCLHCSFCWRQFQFSHQCQVVQNKAFGKAIINYYPKPAKLGPTWKIAFINLSLQNREG